MMLVKKCALGCLVLLASACGALTNLCEPTVPPKARTPPVNIYDLTVDVSVFPEGWDACLGPGGIPEREHGESESVIVGFCPEDFDGSIGAARYEVFRYRNEPEAARSFLRHGFLNRDLLTPLAVTDEWSYESPIADRFRFACARINILGVGYWTCNAVAQYDEYISFLSTHLSPENMTFGDLERILIAIDDRMLLYLEEDAQ